MKGAEDGWTAPQVAADVSDERSVGGDHRIAAGIRAAIQQELRRVSIKPGKIQQAGVAVCAGGENGEIAAPGNVEILELRVGLGENLRIAAIGRDRHQAAVLPAAGEVGDAQEGRREGPGAARKQRQPAFAARAGKYGRAHAGTRRPRVARGEPQGSALDRQIALDRGLDGEALRGAFRPHRNAELNLDRRERPRACVFGGGDGGHPRREQNKCRGEAGRDSKGGQQDDLEKGQGVAFRVEVTHSPRVIISRDGFTTDCTEKTADYTKNF